jgi:hypothetical protein
VLAVLARGDDPPEPPAALRAPLGYFADTPATRRATKARLAVLARGDDPPEPPAALRAPRGYFADTPATRRATKARLVSR